MNNTPDIRSLFRERIQNNYEDFYRDWLSSSADELIYEADQIAATQTVFNSVMDFIREDDMEYLLQYENPLEILRDFWLSESTASIFDMKSCIRNAVDSEEVPDLYERISDDASEEQTM